MAMIKRLLLCVTSMAAMARPVLALQATAGQGGFVNANSLPPAEQLPAWPLLIAAYAFVWVALMVYVWSIWSRIGRVERDIQALQQKGKGASR
jgi:CcmD family protein